MSYMSTGYLYLYWIFIFLIGRLISAGHLLFSCVLYSYFNKALIFELDTYISTECTASPFHSHTDYDWILLIDWSYVCPFPVFQAFVNSFQSDTSIRVAILSILAAGTVNWIFIFCLCIFCYVYFCLFCLFFTLLKKKEDLGQGRDYGDWHFIAKIK